MSRLNVINGVIQNRAKIYDNDDSAPSELSSGNSSKYYKITVSGRSFNAVSSLGKKMTSGRKVAVVVKKTEAIMFKDMDSGKIFGYLGPWVLLITILLLISFNILFIPYYSTAQTSDKLALLISFNALIGALFLVAFRYFLNERKAFKLLQLIK